jgi:hypothetical protein
MTDKLTPAVRQNAERWMQEESLRAAEVAFITDQQRHTLDHWYEQICARTGVDFARLQARAEKGKWADRREGYWQAISQEVLTRSKHRAVKDRLDELRQIHAVREDVLDLITPKVQGGRKVYPVAPHSYEGMVNAFVKLDQLADLKRTAILSAIEPHLVPGTEPKSEMVGGGNLTATELQEITRVLLQQRLQAQQQREQLELPKQPAEDAPDDGDGESD